MKIAHNWLKEYVDTGNNVEETSRILTDLGLEVEKTEKIGFNKEQFNHIVIGKIIKLEKHPNADKLSIAQVDTGDEFLQIVCGAPNVENNKFVIVAKVGSTLYPKGQSPLNVKKIKIRGVESKGMLCSEFELGLGDNNDGIWISKAPIEPGTSVYDLFNLEEDYQFEIGLTPNRSDALGMIGVARDLLAYDNFHKNSLLNLNWPKISNFEVVANPTEIQIEIESNKCLKYCGVLLSNIQIQDSPFWIKRKLESVGIKSINNIVDVTNFVMWELGTPLHAFDADSVNNKVVVKKSEKNSSFVTLDGVKRTLNGEELMITNGTEDLCLAGVMGGLNSGISNKTTSVFIESALFDPVNIRKTSKYHGISSDSSFRFERGIDPELTLFTLKRATSLIVEITNAKLSSNFIEVNNFLSGPKVITIDLLNINKKIGFNLNAKTIEKILELLDVKIISKKNSSWEIEIPHFRHDVCRECDIIEEILRIYGYNNVPTPDKMSFSIGSNMNFTKEKVRAIISNFLVSNGFYEVMNNSLNRYDEIDEDWEAVKIMNPLSLDLQFLRHSILHGLIENASYNLNRQSNNLKLFEFGRTYKKDQNGYLENEEIGILISGDKKNENWISKKENVSIYSLKGLVENILITSGIDKKDLKQHQANKQIFYSYNNKNLATLSELPQSELNKYNIKQKVFVAKIETEPLTKIKENHKTKSSDLPKSFVIRRDFAILFKKEFKYSDIEKSILNLKITHLLNMDLFDVYEGKNIESNKKSYAISFYFQDKNLTLKDETVDNYMQIIEKMLIKEYDAKLR